MVDQPLDFSVAPDDPSIGTSVVKRDAKAATGVRFGRVYARRWPEV
jgi:hypothetical protein